MSLVNDQIPNKKSDFKILIPISMVTCNDLTNHYFEKIKEKCVQGTDVPACKHAKVNFHI